MSDAAKPLPPLTLNADEKEALNGLLDKATGHVEDAATLLRRLRDKLSADSEFHDEAKAKAADLIIRFGKISNEIGGIKI